MNPFDIDIAVRVDSADDIPAFAQSMADTLKAGHEFVYIVEDDAGARRVIFSIRRDGEVFKIRDAEGVAAGTFASAEAAIRAGQRLGERD